MLALIAGRSLTNVIVGKIAPLVTRNYMIASPSLTQDIALMISHNPCAEEELPSDISSYDNIVTIDSNDQIRLARLFSWVPSVVIYLSSISTSGGRFYHKIT